MLVYFGKERLRHIGSQQSVAALGKHRMVLHSVVHAKTHTANPARMRQVRSRRVRLGRLVLLDTSHLLQLGRTWPTRSAVAFVCAPYAWFMDESILFPAVLFGMYAAQKNRRRLLPIFVVDTLAAIEVFARIPTNRWYFLWTPAAWLAWYLYATR